MEACCMWYAILGNDTPDSLQKRASARAAHLARLQLLQAQGRLLLAGPLPRIDAEDPGPAGFSGSLIVAEFEDLASARHWAEDDPYVAAGVYAGVDVRPFRKVLP
jgi:uncharacterized protein YciI